MKCNPILALHAFPVYPNFEILNRVLEMQDHQNRDDLSGDLLYGAAAIARFLFGSEKDRRKVYGLADSAAIPTFKLNGVACGRRTSIASRILERERIGRSPHDLRSNPEGSG